MLEIVLGGLTGATVAAFVYIALRGRPQPTVTQEFMSFLSEMADKHEHPKVAEQALLMLTEDRREYTRGIERLYAAIAEARDVQIGPGLAQADDVPEATGVASAGAEMFGHNLNYDGSEQ